MKKKLLITTTLHQAGMDLLHARPDVKVEILNEVSAEELPQAIHDANAIIVRSAPVTRELVHAAPQLEVVSRTGVGCDNVDIAALTERGIPLTITPGSNAVSVAEHTLYLMLSLAKQGPHYDRATRQGKFDVRFSMLAVDVAVKHLLIIGFGRVGSQVAPRAHALGMVVHAYDPYVDDSVIETAGGVPEASLEAGLASADIVSLHCSLTAETRGMISAPELRVMKPSAFLINTARGSVVDERALAVALREGRLAGAGIDVFETEPPPTDHPLLALPNVIVSPHCAGVSLEASIRAATAAIGNVLHAFDGELDPEVVVNPEVLTPTRA